MTDLFIQLAARTLGLMPLVQPRIDSLFTPKIATEMSEPATAFAASAPSAAIAQASWNEIAAAPPLVNPYRLTLPIARAPRSVAPAIVPSLADDRVVSSVPGDRTVPDVSPAADRRGLETNFTPQRDAALSPAEVPRSSPISTSDPAAMPFAPALVPTENVMSNAIVSPAINSNERQARSVSEPSRSSERLPSPPPDPALTISRDSLAAELAMANSAHADSRTGQILISQKVLRRDRAAAQPVISSPPPDLVKISPAETVPAVVMPRQTNVLLPMERSPSRQPEARAAASPPTIQVTIGRIEVRAVPPSAPPRPRAATPTVRLSLEDYLRSRSGGER